MHFLAEEHSAALDFQKGDVQYVNNLSIFHARNGFRDEPDRECVLVLSHMLFFYGDANGMTVLGVIC